MRKIGKSLANEVAALEMIERWFRDRDHPPYDFQVGGTVSVFERLSLVARLSCSRLVNALRYLYRHIDRSAHSAEKGVSAWDEM